MYLDPPCEKLISKLPRDILLLADFERGGYRKDGIYIDEYSLGYSGPSETYLSVKETAARYGIPVIPKLQLGTTHELATIRTLPIYPSLFRKADYIRKTGTLGFLGCWNFGNLPSASLKAFHFFLSAENDRNEETALKAFAGAKFPQADPDQLLRAWHDFAEAMEQYPFSIPFLYNSPINHVLGLIPRPGILDGRSVGRSWLPDERGDSYHNCITPVFPLEDIIARLERMTVLWDQGLRILEKELDTASPEYVNAAVCGAVWHSGVNMFKIYQLRLKWCDDALPQYRQLVQKELENTERALPFVLLDPEQGWHIEGDFHSFSVDILKKKIADLKSQL